MITKDQLNLLKASLEQHQAPQLTISGSIGAEVRSQSFNEKVDQFRKGQQSMSQATRKFRDNVQEKIHLGVRNTHPQSFPKAVPEHDRTIAERTWTQNSLQYHEGKLVKVSDNLKVSVKQAFKTPSRSR